MVKLGEFCAFSAHCSKNAMIFVHNNVYEIVNKVKEIHIAIVEQAVNRWEAENQTVWSTSGHPYKRNLQICRKQAGG